MVLEEKNLIYNQTEVSSSEAISEVNSSSQFSRYQIRMLFQISALTNRSLFSSFPTMRHITILPVEILLNLAEALENPLDVFHLAITCCW